MTEHLPECLALLNDSTWDGDCICAALRACEERAWKIAYVAYGQGLGAGSDEHGQHEVGFVKGYAAALDAAREAVASMEIAVVGNSAATVDQALAVIESLRKGSNG